MQIDYFNLSFESHESEEHKKWLEDGIAAGLPLCCGCGKAFMINYDVYCQRCSDIAWKRAFERGKRYAD
jgi:hypothetical protein